MASWKSSWLRLFWLALDDMMMSAFGYVAVVRSAIARRGCEWLQK
jgi:hypothetical protein